MLLLRGGGAKIDGDDAHADPPREGGNGEDDGGFTPQRDPFATMDVPMALAGAEYSEQMRCVKYSQLILHSSDHKRALICHDEHAMQMKLERGPSVESTKSNGDSNSFATLVERGMDRLWLARLVEKASSNDMPIGLCKDSLMSFECEEVSSVSKAIAYLQR